MGGGVIACLSQKNNRHSDFTRDILIAVTEKACLVVFLVCVNGGETEVLTSQFEFLHLPTLSVIHTEYWDTEVYTTITDKGLCKLMKYNLRVFFNKVKHDIPLPSLFPPHTCTDTHPQNELGIRQLK